MEKVVKFSGNSKLLASGRDDGNVRIWSFPDLSKVHEFYDTRKRLTIDFSPDNTKAASILKTGVVWYGT